MSLQLPASYWSARWRLRQALLYRLLEQRPDDCFIASFPRSGSTWLRTILTNVLIPEANSNPDVFNALIPGVGLWSVRAINKMKSRRLLKTHTDWRPAIQRAVYLVRDGRDAVVSLYHYQVTRRKMDLTFESFYEKYRAGVFGIHWHRHVEAWLVEGKEALGSNLLVVPFADLKANTAETVAHVLEFLDVSATDHELQTAISKAGIDRMRQIERRRRGDVGQTNASFYRGGATGQWDDYFSPEIMADFNRIESHALRLAGYSS